MGLDLHCGELSGADSVRFGRYSYVHTVRLEWIVAFLKWLRSQRDTNKEIYEMLRNVVKDGKINYELFSKVKSDCRVFQGLKIFVDHSDCDGIWTSVDSEDILVTLDAIRDHLKPLNPEEFDNSEKYYLEDILRLSASSGQTIRFG